MSSPFKTLGAALNLVFALCFAAPNAHADAFTPIITTTGCSGSGQLPTLPDAAASAGDSERKAIRKEAVASNACFRSAENGRSLTEAPCDLSALEVSAREGQVDAQNQLGLVSALLGKGTDIRQARHWFEKAARRGYAPAQVNLAVIYINGWGTAQNYGAALNWLTAAAKQGALRAYADLGVLYMNGWGVRRDYAEARKYLELAAKAGDSGAQSNLGYLYDGGLGVVQDYALAAHWYHLAAENGHALGQHNLAVMFLRGQGVRQSYQQAFYWFEKAAQQGNTGARIDLGFLLMNGLGTAKDPVAAYAWILAASTTGDHRGDDYLAALRATLDQRKLAQATLQAQSLNAAASQRSIRFEPGTLVTPKERAAAK
jgi:TPR repeat protein